jgi:hypothetical protein
MDVLFAGPFPLLPQDRDYSPMFLPAGFAITFGVAFANLTGIFFHIALYHQDSNCGKPPPGYGSI